MQVLQKNRIVQTLWLLQGAHADVVSSTWNLATNKQPGCVWWRRLRLRIRKGTKVCNRVPITEAQLLVVLASELTATSIRVHACQIGEESLRPLRVAGEHDTAFDVRARERGQQHRG